MQSSRPWAIYKLVSTSGKIYIGKTNRPLITRLNDHRGQLKRGTHPNCNLVQEHELGHEFTIYSLSIHHDSDEARLAEDQAIFEVPKELLLNIRQIRNKPREKRWKEPASLEVKKKAIKRVKQLLKKGIKIIAAVNTAAAETTYKPITIYTWYYTQKPWSGNRIQALRQLNEKEIE